MGFRAQKAAFLKKYWIYGFSDRISVSKSRFLKKILDLRLFLMPGTKLLVRRPKKSLSNMYDHLTDDLLSCCPFVAHKSRNIATTVLYTKLVEVGAIA